MKRLIINLVAILIIFIGGTFLIIPEGANAAVVVPQQKYVQLDTCGECSTNDPNKCCKKTWFGCKTYTCKEQKLK